MSELIAAIIALWNGSAGAAARAAFPGGLWYDEAPEGKPYPYVVFGVVAAPTVIAYPGEMYYRATLRFTAYGAAVDCGPVGTAYPLLDALFGAASGFAVAGKSMDWTAPGGKPIPRYRGKDKAGNDVWMVSSTYDYSISQ